MTTTATPETNTGQAHARCEGCGEQIAATYSSRYEQWFAWYHVATGREDCA